MEILNETDFPVTPILWEDAQGQAKLTVVVKATFDIKDGRLLSVDSQLPIFTQDIHHGGDFLASVRFESDMVPFKPRADVVLIGKAYAPGAKSVKQIDVSMRIGGVQKTIRVFGDRRWHFANRLKLIPSVSPPMPFVRMNLTYENAFGGIDSAEAVYCRENIYGKGITGRKKTKSINGKPLPNLEDPYDLIKSWKSTPRPACFGFYPRGGMPRLRYAGTYDDDYRRTREPELPEDFSYEIFNGAHPDLQIVGFLHGDEPVELVNLCEEPVLRFNLPGIRPKLTISKWSIDPDEWLEKNPAEDPETAIEKIPKDEQVLEPQLDTLVLIPDEGIFYEVFRGVCPLRNLESTEIAQIIITQ